MCICSCSVSFCTCSKTSTKKPEIYSYQHTCISFITFVCDNIYLIYKGVGAIRPLFRPKNTTNLYPIIQPSTFAVRLSRQ